MDKTVMAGKRLRAAIVGGGIGGLSAANALVRRGINVTVFEQAGALGEVGAGVFIYPNALRQLERMGLREALAQVGARVGEGSEYYRMDGSVVGRILTTDSRGWNGLYGMHRADLLGVLAEALPPGVIRTGHRCVGFEQNGDAARLTFANGNVVETDIVIAADGIQSGLQKYVVEPSLPEYSGSRAYRGLIATDKVPGWRKEAHQVWMGDGKHFMVFPVRSGRLLNYVGFVPTESETVEIVVRDRRSRRARGLVRRLGSARGRAPGGRRELLLVGPLRPQAAGVVDQGAPRAAGRRGARHASACRPGC